MAIYLSVVIPVYNESERIGKTLALFRDYFDSKSYEYEVIVVDDGSTDTGLATIQKFAESWPQLRVVANTTNCGKGAVVRQGMLMALGEIILFTDADNSTPIEQIEKLLPNIEQYPVVFGSRHCPEGKILIPQSLHRVWLSRMSNLLIRWLAVPGIYDTQCGFKLFQREPAREIFERVTIDRFGFDFEALAIARYLGYSFKEVGVDWYNDGDSKVRAGRDAIRTLWDLFKVRRNLNAGVYKKKSYDINIVSPAEIQIKAEDKLLEKVEY